LREQEAPWCSVPDLGVEQAGCRKPGDRGARRPGQCL